MDLFLKVMLQNEEDNARLVLTNLYFNNLIMAMYSNQESRVVSGICTIIEGMAELEWGVDAFVDWSVPSVKMKDGSMEHVLTTDKTFAERLQFCLRGDGERVSVHDGGQPGQLSL